MLRRFGFLLTALALVGACGKSTSAVAAYSAPPAPVPAKGAPPWPRPANTTQLGKMEGVNPDRKEYLTFHIHSHLDVFVNGKRVLIPGGLGIEIRDPGVKYFPPEGKTGAGYGGIETCAHPCITPLHTHGGDGIVHVEALKKKDYRLGQFFTEWAVRLDSSCVGGYCTPAAKTATFVDGKRYSGDPSGIRFEDHGEIAIVIGSPPTKIPASYDFSDA